MKRKPQKPTWGTSVNRRAPRRLSGVPHIGFRGKCGGIFGALFLFFSAKILVSRKKERIFVQFNELKNGRNEDYKHAEPAWEGSGYVAAEVG